MDSVEYIGALLLCFKLGAKPLCFIGVAVRHHPIDNHQMNDLIPQVLFIVFQFVFFEEFDKFLLKCSLIMMSFLVCNVITNYVHLRLTDGETAISSLPCKVNIFFAK